MNLILILIIPMMSNRVKQLRQLPPLFTKLHKLLPANHLISIPIDHPNHALDRLRLQIYGDVFCRLVFEAVGCVQVVEVPGTAIVEVVETKEGAGVEVGDVVLLWKCVS